MAVINSPASGSLKGVVTMSKYNLIMLLGNNSKTEEHELILECMDAYKKVSTMELTTEELYKFCEGKGLVLA